MCEKSLKNSQLHNKGFSLIELIIVIAMLAVLIGLAGASLNYLNGPEAGRAASSVDAVLNEVKTGAMSRNSEYVVFRYITLPSRSEMSSDAEYNLAMQKYTDNGIVSEGFYAEKHISTIQEQQDIALEYATVEYTMVASKKVTIRYNGSSADSDNGTELLADGTNAIRIEFDRRTGRLKKLMTKSLSGDRLNGYKQTDNSGWTEVGDINNLTFRCGLRQVGIEFIPLTGKHSIK